MFFCWNFPNDCTKTIRSLEDNASDSMFKFVALAHFYILLGCIIWILSKLNRNLDGIQSLCEKLHPMNLLRLWRIFLNFDKKNIRPIASNKTHFYPLRNPAKLLLYLLTCNAQNVHCTVYNISDSDINMQRSTLL